MVINCIHDVRRKDRYDLLQKEIELHNLNIVYWPSVHDTTMPFRGINLAHKQVIIFAKHQGLPMVCISEDDFKLTAPGAWEYFLDNIPNDFDVYLSGIYKGHIKEDGTVDNFCALHLYIVHERFYDKFLAVDEKNNIDTLLGSVGKCVVCQPFVAVQHNGWSDHKNGYYEYEQYLEGRKLFGVNS